MDTIEKLIGIPRKNGAVNYTGTDCLGICILFLREHGLDLPFNSNMLFDNIFKMNEFLGNFQTVYDIRNIALASNCENLRYGDLLYIYRGHWGICITEEILLSCSNTTKLFDLNKIKSEKRLLSIYRPKMKINPIYLPTGKDDLYE